MLLVQQRGDPRSHRRRRAVDALISTIRNERQEPPCNMGCRCRGWMKSQKANIEIGTVDGASEQLMTGEVPSEGGRCSSRATLQPQRCCASRQPELVERPSAEAQQTDEALVPSALGR